MEKHIGKPGNYLIFFGRIHHDKGAKEAIEIAKKAKPEKWLKSTLPTRGQGGG